MMNSRMMKGRPRLVPPDDYQASTSVNLWIDDKESDITSVSSASSDDSGETGDDESTLMSDDMDRTQNTRETEEGDEEEEEEEEDEDNESTLDHTLEPSNTNNTDISEKTQDKFNEVTPLFHAIDSDEWDSVFSFLETGSWGWKWSSLCAHLYNVIEKSAAAQARTWVLAKKKDGKGEIRRLPLHAAMAHKAPFKVIQILVKTYPKGAKNPDSDGNYPLHLAFETCASIQTLTFLMKEFPQAIHLKNEAGKLPTECGAANGISELLQLSIGATKTQMETELTKEKGNLEEDRKQLLEVTKELMNLKKMVAERERNMTKDNFLYQKQHLSSAISQLTKLKKDLDKHEDNVLQTHLVAEKKRMDGVLGELNKTKGELDKIKLEHNLTPTTAEIAEAKATMILPSPVSTQQKKRRSKKVKKVLSNRHALTGEDAAEARRDVAETTYNQADEEQGGQSKEWNGREDLVVDTDNMDPDIGGSESFTPRSIEKTGSGQSPRKLKTVAARFKKKMHWRKSEKSAAAEAE